MTSTPVSSMLHAWDSARERLGVVRDQHSLVISSAAAEQAAPVELKLPYHMDTIYTSIDWSQFAAQNDTEKSQRSSKKQKQSSSGLEQQNNSPYVALGTQDGRIIVWNAARSEIARELHLPGRGNSNGNATALQVNGVAFISATQLIAITADAIYMADVFSGGSSKQNSNVLSKIFAADQLPRFSTSASSLARIVFAPNSRYFAVGTTSGGYTYLFEVSSKRPELKLRGHAAGVSGADLLKFAGNQGQILVTGSSTDRHVHIFNLVSSSGAGGDVVEPAKSLTVDAPLASLDVMSSPENPQQIDISLITSSGKGHVFRVSIKKNKVKLIAQSACELTGGNGKTGNAFVSCAFLASQGELVLAYGATAHQMQFARIASADLFSKTLHSIRAVVLKASSSSANGEQQSSAVATTDGTSAAQNGVLLTSSNSETADARLQRAFGSETLGSATASSLEERIADIDTTALLVAAKNNSKAVPELEMTSALIQALKSQDKAMIAQCLQQSDVDLIRITVRKLPVQCVVPLLEAILEQYGDLHRNTSHLVHWIRSLLVLHTSQLMSQPSILHKLSPFYHSISQRLNVYPKLLDLAGRLDLLLALAGHNTMNPSSADDDTADLAAIEEGAAAGKAGSGFVQVVADIDEDDEEGMERVVDMDNDDEDGADDLADEIDAATMFSSGKILGLKGQGLGNGDEDDGFEDDEDAIMRAAAAGSDDDEEEEGEGIFGREEDAGEDDDEMDEDDDEDEDDEDDE